MAETDDLTKGLREKYRWTGHFYDILDYYWERQYRRFRPGLLSDLSGKVIEAGIGTGRNIAHYPAALDIVGIDLSEVMLQAAQGRNRKTGIPLVQADATMMPFMDGSFDWYVATFLFCVLLEPLQRPALLELCRILKPGGRFRLLEIIFSKDQKIRRRQESFAPFVKKVYGASFDRNTITQIKSLPALEVLKVSFLKADTHLLIEGIKKQNAPASQ